MIARPITKNPDILNALEAGLYLGLDKHFANPERVVERLCRQGKLRGRLPSKKAGWQIHKKACDDYFLLGGGLK